MGLVSRLWNPRGWPHPHNAKINSTNIYLWREDRVDRMVTRTAHPAMSLMECGVVKLATLLIHLATPLEGCMNGEANVCKFRMVSIIADVLYISRIREPNLWPDQAISCGSRAAGASESCPGPLNRKSPKAVHTKYHMSNIRTQAFYQGDA